MLFFDFEYDSSNLSDRGFIICKFNANKTETVSNGSNITFNTVSVRNGEKNDLISSTYKECLSAKFQICKHPCVSKDMEISVNETREIMRWLNRKSYKKLKFIHDEYLNIFFEASFNVSKIEINGKVHGFELEVITNRPFALREPVYHTIEITNGNKKKSIASISDEDGYIYPKMEIEIKEDGDLTIHNSAEDRIMRIANCTSGEIIKLDYPVITSSLSSHKVQNDFNWKFFRIAKSETNRRNNLTISLPCIIKIKYNPIVKIGI